MRVASSTIPTPPTAGHVQAPRPDAHTAHTRPAHLETLALIRRLSLKQAAAERVNSTATLNLQLLPLSGMPPEQVLRAVRALHRNPPSPAISYLALRVELAMTSVPSRVSVLA